MRYLSRNCGFAKNIIIVWCRKCGTYFGVCRSCWRGQTYCSRSCRESKKKRLHCQAQRRYRQTEKGKEAHRVWERNRRYQQDPNDENQVEDTSAPSGMKPEPRPTDGDNNEEPEKNMDDAPSSNPNQGIKVVVGITKNRIGGGEGPQRWTKCQFCGQNGKVVQRFGRRDYSQKRGGRKGWS